MSEETLEEHYRVAYQRALGMEFQQDAQRLAGVIDQDYNFTEEPGKSFTADIVGTTRVRKILDRHGDTPSGDVPNRRRRGGHFMPFDVGNALGTKIDSARSVSDPANRILQEEKKSLARHHDDQTVLSIVGTAYSGEQLVTPETLDLTSTVVDDELDGVVIPLDYNEFSDVVAPTLLNGSKIQTAKRIMGRREADREELFVLANSNQISYIMDDPKLSNIDLNTARLLASGDIENWHGFNFRRTENVRELCIEAGLPIPDGVEPVIVCNHMCAQYRSRVLKAPTIYQRQEKRQNWETYGEIESAGCRTHDRGVLIIFCAQPGSAVPVVDTGDGGAGGGGTPAAPTVGTPIPDQTATVDTPFSFAFAAGTFSSTDTLTYTASGMPAWMSFDAATRTFSGTPTTGDEGTSSITVTATDSASQSITDTFDVVTS